MSILIFILLIPLSFSFHPSRIGSFRIRSKGRLWSSTFDVHDPDSKPRLQEEEENEELDVLSSFSVPLKWLGPYPALALRFPNLATSSQRERNVTGVSLDFVLDTAANTNTINAKVSDELELKVVGEALPGVGAAGVISGGNTFLLGDCELDGLPKTEDPFIFMKELTASALPISNPASAGLLSLAFLQCFPGGVEFIWGLVQEGKIVEFPSVVFHADESLLPGNMQQVNITRIPVTQLPSVTVFINGFKMPALLDTGSPITVINHQAAKLARVQTFDIPDLQKSLNPFAKVSNSFKVAQAVGKGEVLQLASNDGIPINLVKSTEMISIDVEGSDEKPLAFGESRIFVGDLPGLAALNGIGVDSPPAVVLGMDVLRKRPRMWLRAQQNEVWFSSQVA
jgi:hypothetical protein